MKKKLLALAIALTFFMPLAVSADETTTDSEVTDPVTEIRAEIQELRNYLQELKDQVENGELTKDEAHELWQTAVAEVREKKQALFDARMEEAKVKYEQLAENHPELADALRTRFEGFREARQIRNTKAKELRESLKNGDITRAEFRLDIQDTQLEFKARRNERKQEFRGFIKDRREQLRGGGNNTDDEDEDNNDSEEDEATDTE